MYLVVEQPQAYSVFVVTYSDLDEECLLYYKSVESPVLYRRFYCSLSTYLKNKTAGEEHLLIL